MPIVLLVKPAVRGGSFTLDPTISTVWAQKAQFLGVRSPKRFQTGAYSAPVRRCPLVDLSQMLCELRVENLLLIERTELVFAPGLNVLTGETGAGKTVLAHALDLLMGGRSRNGIVRPGAEEAYVEGVFSVSEGIREEVAEQLPENVRVEDAQQLQEIVLGRRVYTDGRTRAYLNGRAAAVGDLRELGARLIAFYGQHEHRKLVLAGAQLRMLDEVCPATHSRRLEACAASYREIRAHEAELERLGALQLARERDLDLLEHDLAEIDDAAPEEQEYRALTLRRERLRSLEALHSAAATASGALAPEAPEQAGAVHLLATAAAKLDAVGGIDPALDAHSARCAALAIEAQDVASGLQAYCEEAHEEDGTLEQVEGRLAALERLMRKHGGSIQAIGEYAEQARARREELLGATVAQDRTADALASEQAKLEEHVQALRTNRKKASKRLAIAFFEYT